MPAEEIVRWAIAVAAFLATALIVYVLIDAVFGQEQLSSDSETIGTVSGNGQAANRLERRRSERLLLRVPLLVYGHAPGKEPFHEKARTLEISSHGGLLTVVTRVWVGQKLLLTNIANQEERECHVVRLGVKHSEEREVAIEFTQPAPEFWNTNTLRPEAAPS